MMIGAALSPIIFRLGGYDASFLSGITLRVAALGYLIFFTKDPIVRY